MSDFVSLVRDLGFPVAVAVFLVWDRTMAQRRMQQMIETQAHSMKNLNTQVVLALEHSSEAMERGNDLIKRTNQVMERNSDVMAGLAARVDLVADHPGSRRKP